ncbi:hypothetical protein C8F01DRAFT_975113 [Mycena amicta]|nr:hypothetical protein C8F01DRAFT_987983 [Mycena amicta]KAJ7070511.1 hypothetical protein C8F01DRAFT_975113 [Mycena amicta]
MLANEKYSSTTNTRIERLWVEVGSQFARCWRAFFYRLEARHQLNRKNAQHLWLLHHLFLDLINEDCDEFRQVWNVKPISGEAHNKSPEVSRLLLQHGSYSAVDDYDDVHPTVLQSYYGTHGSPRTNNDTGAGQLEDEAISDADSDIEADEEESDFDPDEHSDSEAIAAAVAEAQGDNFHHEPVAVPKHECPFGDDDLQLFTRSLQAASSANMVPHGYGLLEEEWEDEGYPSFEIIKSGRRGRKELRIDLPDHIWRPRAELWGCALAILNQIGFMNES